MTNRDGLDKILMDLAVRIDALEQGHVNAPRLGEETTRSIYDTLHKLLNVLEEIVEQTSYKKCSCKREVTIDRARVGNVSRTQINIVETEPENENGSD